MIAKAKPDAPASRKRRRPRTVMDDEQTPDRLRKQLRVAQQVHLRRKEITIANLQSRVQELEAGIEKLSQSILSFSDLLFEADGLKKHPHVTSAFGTRRWYDAHQSFYGQKPNVSNQANTHLRQKSVNGNP
ncbi:uncharacterized protein N7458_004301 [Penicillium daleae]|uniref:Uncharacterized protein n=1 Tax=Penicillium daleae TaxID=63821 RepID=A0AAD6G5P8_9EURO|nr:uncharacterized protein N7458_004301 [Penicillium daleae]KAJ5456037.1 hypothetical protein N7458_004301 [Penicillium daleae]